MRAFSRWPSIAIGTLLLFACLAQAHQDGPQQTVSFTTVSITPYAVEGLAGDNASSLYTTGRAPAGTRCPVWRINVDGASSVTPVQVGSIPNASDPSQTCNPSGIAFDKSGNIYVADAAQGGVVWRLTGSDPDPTTPFASGVPGTNGVAFDREGNLWTGDGTTNDGRVWRIAPAGGVCEPAFTGCDEVFRVPAMKNTVGVGRDNATLQSGSTTPNSQRLVANGLAFGRDGDLFIADTARGALWRVVFDHQGKLRSPQGCDSSYPAKTLCFANVFVAHPLLEGADGIALDRAGNIWTAANERNAIVIVTPGRRVIEAFRNPVNANGLRNAADTPEGNRHILEFPTSPYLNGSRFCVANSDGNRRDNAPNVAGEIYQAGAVGARGKISCMDDALHIPGLPLPIH